MTDLTYILTISDHGILGGILETTFKKCKMKRTMVQTNAVMDTNCTYPPPYGTQPSKMDAHMKVTMETT